MPQENWIQGLNYSNPILAINNWNGRGSIKEGKRKVMTMEEKNQQGTVFAMVKKKKKTGIKLHWFLNKNLKNTKTLFSLI